MGADGAVWMAGDAGLFRLPKGSSAWATILGLGPEMVSADIAFAPDGAMLVSYLEWFGGKILRSSGGGTSWTAVSNTPLRNIVVGGDRALYGGDTASLGETIRGVWRSRDNGKTWSLFNNGLSQQAVNAYSLAATSDGFVFATIAVGKSSVADIGLYRLVGVPTRCRDAWTSYR
jgi:photosystem II stability/assembly factor-like uncharacterized protein